MPGWFFIRRRGGRGPLFDLKNDDHRAFLQLASTLLLLVYSAYIVTLITLITINHFTLEKSFDEWDDESLIRDDCK